MRYYLDTEFVEDGKTIDLISIGIVDQNGRTYYAVNRECDFTNASPWVWENVLRPMGIYDSRDILTNPGSPEISPRLRETILASRCRETIASEILQFIGFDDEIEFWADYCAYDWVAFCQLYGTMMEDLPRHFPMYCNDLQQALTKTPGISLPPQVGQHHALHDAIWCKNAHEAVLM